MVTATINRGNVHVDVAANDVSSAIGEYMTLSAGLLVDLRKRLANAGMPAAAVAEVLENAKRSVNSVADDMILEEKGVNVRRRW